MISEDQLVLLINTILSSDNELRKTNEAHFQQLRDVYPNEFITSLVRLCRNPELSIRQFASVHLRNCTSNFTPKNFKNVWPELQPQTKDFVKEQLFVLLSEEKSSNVRNQISDCIGEIGGSLFALETNEWPGLLPLLWQMFLSPRNEIIEAGFRIMSNLFSFGIEMFNRNIADLGALFNQGIVNGDIRIRTAALQAIGNYVQSSEYKQHKQFEDLVPMMIQSTYEVLVQDEELGEDCLEVFSDLVESEYKFIRKHFATFFQGIQLIFREKKIDQGVKRIGTESIILLAEKQPKLFKDNKAFINQLVEMIFYHMIQISDSVSDVWMRPPEGFNDDIEQDDDLETMRFGMSSIDRLIDCIGEKIMLPILSSIVQQLFQHQDWRYKYSAIMALSQVGEYIEEIAEIKPIVDVVMSMLNDVNPMIRYAVCHAIGQIADDMKPKFQEAYIATILPQFIQRLTIEDVPRVTSHILACLTNFVEGVPNGIQQFIQQLVVLSVSYLTNGISIVKENAISVLAATAESAKLDFVPYIQELLPILFNVLEVHTTKEYKQLKGQCIEAITLIASSVTKEPFRPYLDRTVNYLIQIQEGHFEATDPQKSYVLSGWQRLCLVCPDLLEPYLPRILPSLFTLVQVIFEIKKPQEAASTSYHTYDDEEAEIAINMLSVFIEELKEKFFPYFDTATQLIVPLCTFSTDESIRKASSKCLVSLIENVKSTGQKGPLFQGAKYFLGVILEAAQKEFDPEVIIEQVDCLKEIIDTVQTNFMTYQEINELSEKVFKLLLESDTRKAENENIAKEEDCDEDEKDLIKEENQTEEELHVKIAEFIGVLFKTHREQVQPLCEIIFTQILPKVLDPNLTPKMHQFGIFLIDDIVEHLGYTLAGPKFADFAKALSLYASNKVCFVRQAAVYGIGVLAGNTPKEVYPQFGQQLLQAIVNSLQIPKNENDSDKQYGHCRDNSIAALGKIIKSQSESLGGDLQGALQTWLNLLPLRFDKPEAIIQHSFLAEVVQYNGNQLLNGKQENALQVLKIFADVHGTKRSNQECNVKIVAALKVFETLEGVQQNWSTLFAMLTPEHQTKLVQVASSNA